MKVAAGLLLFSELSSGTRSLYDQSRHASRLYSSGFWCLAPGGVLVMGDTTLATMGKRITAKRHLPRSSTSLITIQNQCAGARLMILLAGEHSLKHRVWALHFHRLAHPPDGIINLADIGIKPELGGRCLAQWDV